MVARIVVGLEDRTKNFIKPHKLGTKDAMEKNSNSLSIGEILKLAEKVNVWEHKSQFGYGAFMDGYSWDIYEGTLVNGTKLVYSGYATNIKVISPNGYEIGFAWDHEDERLKQLWNKIDGARRRDERQLSNRYKRSEKRKLNMGIRAEVRSVRELIRA